MSHYATLEVTKDADAAAIKRAYRKKSREAHPDRAGGDTTRMVAINRAYETLSNPEKRKRYDATGQDNPVPTVDAQAIEAVMQLFMQMIERCDESDDVIDLVRKEIKGNQSKFKAEQVHMRAAIRSLEKRRKKLKHKATTRNFLDDLLADRIKVLTENIAAMDANLALGDRALELLKDYEYEGERRQQSPQSALYGIQALFGQQWPR